MCILTLYTCTLKKEIVWEFITPASYSYLYQNWKENKIFHTGKTKIMSKVFVKVHDHLLIVVPSTTQCQLYVWRYILVERASTHVWTLIHQLSMHKYRWCTTVLHSLGVWRCQGIRISIFISGSGLLPAQQQIVILQFLFQIFHAII